MSEPRCIHRHTAKTHPNCFKRGLIVPEVWWEGQRIAYLDIETSNFDADFGDIVTWCLKYANEKKIHHSVITKEELFNYDFDKRLIQELVDELFNVDIVVTYYGKGFDVKFLRARAAYYQIPFPKYGSIYHWDLYFHVKKDFKISRKSLDRVTHFLGIEGKTHLDPHIWKLARYGHPDALQEVLHHNKEDVVILEELHKRIGDYSKWMRTSI